MQAAAATHPVWREALRVGHAHIDAEHEDFARLIEQLRDASDDALLAALDRLLAHAGSHFADEDTWMRRLDFPAKDCHQQEHQAVLATAQGVRRRLLAGETHPVRHFAAELAAWFPPHVQHLDSALAQWICKHTWDAKPLVLHRRMPVQELVVQA